MNMRSPVRTVFAAVLILALILCPSSRAEPREYFAIHVVDEQTGRGVPLVELKTTNHIADVTDSNGFVAFNEPGLMNERVWFTVTSHGYEHAADGFGSRGVALDVRPGGRATVRVKRLSIAERLYRVTGQGIYRDSLLLGEPVPLKQPALNAKVMGQDSVMAAVYGGTIRWFWGDTSQPRYPLGLFRTSGATSLLPGKGGLAPDVGVDLKYFVDKDGFSRAMAPLPESPQGAIWIDGLLTVNDESGRERM